MNTDEDYLQPLEFKSKKEWRDCAVFHENKSVRRNNENRKLKEALEKIKKVNGLMGLGDAIIIAERALDESNAGL